MKSVRHSSTDPRAELYSSPHLATISLPVVLVSYDQLAPENTDWNIPEINNLSILYNFRYHSDHSSLSLLLLLLLYLIYR